MTASANELGTALVERLGWCLVHSVWQGAAVALLVGRRPPMAPAILGTGPILDRLRGPAGDGDFALGDTDSRRFPTRSRSRHADYDRVMRQWNRAPCPTVNLSRIVSTRTSEGTARVTRPIRSSPRTEVVGLWAA